MFSNVGSKIKTIAIVLTIIGIACWCIIGIAFIVIEPKIWFIGLLYAAAGSFFSWLSSLTLYGAGHLIENSDTLIKKADDSIARTNALIEQNEYTQKEIIILKRVMIHKEFEEKENDNAPVFVATDTEGCVTCPVCGARQVSGRLSCYNCKRRFIR